MWRKPALLVLSVVVPLALLAPRPAEGALEPLQPLASVSAAPSAAVIIDNGAPDGRMAMAARLPSGSAIEIEPGDDFILSAPNQITNASFTGLLPTGQPLSSVRDVLVEIYRVFPKDSVNPPSGRVPTRNNSPSDVAFDSRQASAGTLSFTTTLLNQSFSAANSVVNGINPIPNQRTGGEGTVTGQEVRIDVTLTSPFTLPADHYFFVPQVQLANGTFLWLSAPGPPNFTGDLQAWIRNANLDPDWLRVGTDIVGGTPPPTFNGSFSLQGSAICTTRPNVGVTVAPAGSGRLQATLRANTNTSTPINHLLAIQFTSATGAVVQDAGGTSITVPSNILPPGTPATFSFFIRKAVATQPATVVLTVTDACGPWPTFVGGGASAFPPEPPPAAPAAPSVPGTAASTTAAVAPAVPAPAVVAPSAVAGGQSTAAPALAAPSTAGGGQVVAAPPAAVAAPASALSAPASVASAGAVAPPLGSSPAPSSVSRAGVPAAPLPLAGAWAPAPGVFGSPVPNGPLWLPFWPVPAPAWSYPPLVPTWQPEGLPDEPPAAGQ